MNLQPIQNKIYEIRGYRVMLDFDLAAIYQVETRRLNEAVKRNIKRFPPDFMFQLTSEEWKNLKSQFVISTDNISSQIEITKPNNLMSQIATSSWGGTRKLPLAFTEHGVSMLAGILKSDVAIEESIRVIRAFIALKEFALNYKELADKLVQLEQKYDKQFNTIDEVLNYLMQKDKQETEQKERKRIGFK